MYLAPRQGKVRNSQDSLRKEHFQLQVHPMPPSVYPVPSYGNPGLHRNFRLGRKLFPSSSVSADCLTTWPYLRLQVRGTVSALYFLRQCGNLTLLLTLINPSQSYRPNQPPSPTFARVHHHDPWTKHALNTNTKTRHVPLRLCMEPLWLHPWLLWPAPAGHYHHRTPARCERRDESQLGHKCWT